MPVPHWRTAISLIHITKWITPAPWHPILHGYKIIVNIKQYQTLQLEYFFIPGVASLMRNTPQTPQWKYIQLQPHNPLNPTYNLHPPKRNLHTHNQIHHTTHFHQSLRNIHTQYIVYHQIHQHNFHRSIDFGTKCQRRKEPTEPKKYHGVENVDLVLPQNYNPSLKTIITLYWTSYGSLIIRIA